MFIQVVQGRATDIAGWKKGFDSWAENVKPVARGFLGSTSGIHDDGRFIIVARFESEEAAEENNNIPEQQKWYEEFSSYMEDVTFTNCARVEEWGDGGSNDAGFVQVIQGKVDDPDEMLEMFRSRENEREESRPDVIGGTVALHDGGFINTVYFTSEAAAREGEKSEETQEMATEMQSKFQDLSYFDISDPIFD